MIYVGLQVEGLYRISGSSATIDKLKLLFNRDAGAVHKLRPPAHSPLVSQRNISKMTSTLSLIGDTDVINNIIPVESLSSFNTHIKSPTRLLSEATQSGSYFPAQSSTFSGSKTKFAPTTSSRWTDIISKSTVLSSSSNSGSALYDDDVHVLTGLVKKLLRDGIGPSNEPLCGFELYEEFVSASRNLKFYFNDA